MIVSKKELKVVSLKFRSRSSELINSPFEDADDRLGSYIELIDSTPIILDYLSSLSNGGHDMDAIFKQGWHKSLFLGDNICERTINTYKMLKLLNESGNKDIVLSFSRVFARKTKFQDSVAEFGSRIILPFARQVEEYLTGLAIEMGYDENATISIKDNSGQINIATHSAHISAAQNNGVNLQELQGMMNDIISNLSAINHSSQEEVKDILDSILGEIQSPSPKKGVLKSFIATLSSISSTIEAGTTLGTSLVKFITFLQSYTS